MLIIQNRITAHTPDDAADKIYKKHNPIQPPRISPVMQLQNGKIWYEYIAVIER